MWDNLRTSRTFRIGALSAGIGPPSHGCKGRLVRDSIADSESVRPASTGRPASIGMGGRLPSEWVAGLRRNHWPHCVGLRMKVAKKRYEDALREKFFGFK
jgi:hypothetical protein